MNNSYLKHLLFICLLSLSTFGFASDSTKLKVVVFEIKEEIAPTATRLVSKALNTAREIQADLIVIDMDTYGGLVNDADSIRFSILNSKIPVVVYINPNAASAGALISIACKKIYMSKGANIGAATVVTQEGSSAPDKYQSYMRSIMRSTAKAHGKILSEDGDSIWYRNPEIAEAMVDQDIEVIGISEKGKVITFTADEAIKYGFCEGIKSNIKEVIEAEGIHNYEIIKVEKNVIDIIFGFLKNPAISGVLVLLIIGGIYYELRTPGVGFPIIVSIVATILYFAPNYIDGLVENWEILLFIIGLALLLIELFVIPGFGITGIAGITFILSSLILALISNDGLDFTIQSPSEIGNAFFVVSIAVGIFIGMLIYSGASLHKSRLLKKVSLESNLIESKSQDLTETTSISRGDIGLAFTDIKPQGKAIINQKIVPVHSIYGLISKGTEIKFLRKEGNSWLIESNLSDNTLS